MKVIYFLLLFLPSNAYAQNRASIIKEVDEYKQKIYVNYSYFEDIETLNELVFNYFSDKNYTFKNTEETPSLIFYKTIFLSCSSSRKQDHDGAPFYKCKRTFYVTVWFSSNLDKSKTIHLSTEIINEQTFNPIFNERVLGTYKFNRNEFYKFLFTSLGKENINLSEEILIKINDYNAKQKHEEKKIVKGRDY